MLVVKFVKLINPFRFIRFRKITRDDFVAFTKSYSTQISFGVIVVVFLAVTVGDNQSTNVTTAGYVDMVNAGVDASYIGKPQLFSDVTVMTGEQQQTTAISYTVEKGDSITSIAARYNLHVASILDANGITAKDAEKITSGQVLLIPSDDSNTNIAWLGELNDAKEAERQKALAAAQKKEAERQRQLALNSRFSRSGSSSNVSVIGRQRFSSPYPYGYCTSYASYRSGLPGGLGNARNWYANARARGYSVGKTPRAGAVMVTTESYWGHVAYVESVSGNSVYVTEMNYAGFGVISSRTVNAGSGFIIGYVYR